MNGAGGAGPPADLAEARATASQARLAVVAARERLVELAPQLPGLAEAEELRKVARDVIAAEQRARQAQEALASRPPPQRLERATSPELDRTNAALGLAERAGRDRLVRAVLLASSALAPLGAGLLGVMALFTAVLFASSPVPLAVDLLLRRRAMLAPARRAHEEALELAARAEFERLQSYEAATSDWNHRLVRAMTADDALREVLPRWEEVAGHGADPSRVELIVEAMAELEQAGAAEEQAASALTASERSWGGRGGPERASRALTPVPPATAGVPALAPGPGPLLLIDPGGPLTPVQEQWLLEEVARIAPGARVLVVTPQSEDWVEITRSLPLPSPGPPPEVAASQPRPERAKRWFAT